MRDGILCESLSCQTFVPFVSFVSFVVFSVNLDLFRPGAARVDVRSNAKQTVMPR